MIDKIKNPFEVSLANLKVFEELQIANNNLTDAVKKYIDTKRQDLEEKNKKYLKTKKK